MMLDQLADYMPLCLQTLEDLVSTWVSHHVHMTMFVHSSEILCLFGV